MRYFGSGVAVLAVLVVGAPQAQACAWLWDCPDQPRAYRAAPPGYGYRPAYRAPARAYRPRGNGWMYGYSSPERAYDPYAAWSSTSIPPSRWYLGSALAGGNTEAVGMTPTATYSGGGQLQGAWPAMGPTLFGPGSAPAPTGYYNGSYYGDPAYGYVPFPSRATPPRETPSWWVEPRRRR